MHPLPIVDDADAPPVPLAHLDHLWFQVGGTRCNLACTHCFISCSPHNYNFGFLDLATVRAALVDAVSLGVKEYYFTGGEPFLNRDLADILELTLQFGPATVLTNGTVFHDALLTRLRRVEAASPYSLEWRVSLDGVTAEENDPVRGAGTFERIVRGVLQLVDHDFLPIVTVTRTRDEQDDEQIFHAFVALLKARGYPRPRVKILPTLRLGAEAERQRGYSTDERVTHAMMEGYDLNRLVCHASRTITDHGVYVCPILIDAPDARLGASLAEARGPYRLRHHACSTCWQHGALCHNATGRTDVAGHVT